MVQRAGTVLSIADGSMMELAQAQAGMLLIRGQTDIARKVLEELGKKIEKELPDHGIAKGKGKLEIEDALWLIHAGYLYKNYEGTANCWQEYLLPLFKRMAQAIISGHFGHLRMDDGGLLNLLGSTDGLILNILWDNALAILDEELHAAGDPSGDHFERLRGRFKRSFLKAFWSDDAGYLVSGPGVIPTPDPAKPAPPPSIVLTGADSMQILHAVLAYSALPRTKQRLVVDLLAKNRKTDMGVLLGHGDEVQPKRYSPVLLAWLAEAHVRTNDAPATAVAEAITWLNPLAERLEREGHLAEFYDDHGKPAPGKEIFYPAMGEIRRVYWALVEAAEKPLGNSKRTRLSGILLPLVRPE